jgi:hypothetical protein
LLGGPGIQLRWASVRRSGMGIRLALRLVGMTRTRASLFHPSFFRQQLLLPHFESLRKSGSQFRAMSHNNENRLLIPVQIEEE